MDNDSTLFICLYDGVPAGASNFCPSERPYSSAALQFATVCVSWRWSLQEAVSSGNSTTLSQPLGNASIA
jgi:hypothetical protein